MIYDKVFEALAIAQSKMSTPPKDRTAKIPMKNGGSYSYKYADLATIVETVKKILSEYGLCVSQTINTSEHGHTLTTMLGHSSGQYIESKCHIPMADDVKSWGGNITYVRRYALTAILGISTDEDTDSTPYAQKDSTNGNNQVPSTTSQEVKPPVVLPPLVDNPQVVQPDAKKWQPSEKQLNRLYAIAKASNYNSDTAGDLLRKKYGVTSSKLLSRDQYDEFCTYLEKNPIQQVAPPNDGFFSQEELTSLD